MLYDLKLSRSPAVPSLQQLVPSRIVIFHTFLHFNHKPGFGFPTSKAEGQNRRKTALKPLLRKGRTLQVLQSSRFFRFFTAADNLRSSELTQVVNSWYPREGKCLWHHSTDGMQVACAGTVQLAQFRRSLWLQLIVVLGKQK